MPHIGRPHLVSLLSRTERGILRGLCNPEAERWHHTLHNGRHGLLVAHSQGVQSSRICSVDWVDVVFGAHFLVFVSKGARHEAFDE